MTKSRIYNRIQNNFTQVSNLALLDTRLSGKAYKLYAYMVFRMGTAPDWYFYEEEILKHFKESRDAIRTAFKELIDNGWLIRKRLKNDKGQYGMTEYEIFSEAQTVDSAPQTENPSLDNPAADKPSEEKAAQEKPTAENTSYNNKEEIKKDSNNKDFISLPSEEKKDFVKKLFKEKFPEFKSSPEEYCNFRERKKGGWKSVGNLEEDLKWWEKNFKDMNPKLYEENPTVKKSLTVESDEIKNLRSEIKAFVCRDNEKGYSDHHDIFLFKPIEKTPSGFVIKVDDERALKYQEVLRQIKVEIEKV